MILSAKMQVYLDYISNKGVLIFLFIKLIKINVTLTQYLIPSENKKVDNY